MINEHNGSVVLPICKKIPFTYEGRLAFSLAATLGQNEKDNEIWEWLYLDFTQIICKKEIKGRIWHTFFHVYNPYNPFLKRKYALRIKKMWKDPEKALNDVVSHINKGYFVHIRLDLHYISALSCGESPLIHSEHIYGYDSKEQKLYLMRYDYNQGIYSVEIGFDEFRKAYTPLIGDSQKLINVYDKVKMKTRISFNSKRLCKRIINYSKENFRFLTF